MLMSARSARQAVRNTSANRSHSSRGDVDAVACGHGRSNHPGHPLLDGNTIGKEAPDESLVAGLHFRGHPQCVYPADEPRRRWPPGIAASQAII